MRKNNKSTDAIDEFTNDYPKKGQLVRIVTPKAYTYGCVAKVALSKKETVNHMRKFRVFDKFHDEEIENFVFLKIERSIFEKVPFLKEIEHHLDIRNEEELDIPLIYARMPITDTLISGIRKIMPGEREFFYEAYRRIKNSTALYSDFDIYV